jgi:hypothetical protein
MINISCPRWVPLLLVAGVFCALHPALNAQTPTPSDVPTVDGAAGPCVLQLTINTADGKPAYGAKVKVHIAYRFGGFHKLDLEAGTNVEGKVKFVGLPSRVRRPPMEFQAAQNDLVGTLLYDPESECQAKHDITIDKPKPSSTQ